MLVMFSIAAILLGTSLASCAEHFPRVVARLETAGGILFIVGLAMVGSSLPLFS